MDKIEILQYNVDLGCDFKCEDCSRFFDCTHEKKAQIYNHWVYKAVKERMAKVKKKIMVLSSKGGVGKSTVSANIAASFADQGYKTGIIDFDLMGPSIPGLLGVADKKIYLSFEEGILPAENDMGIKIMSMAHTLKDNEALTWYHDMKKYAIHGFLSQVNYGELDCLVIDLPPGTGTEVTSILRFLDDLDGAVIVTIPSEVSQKVAQKGLTLCNKAGVNVLGIIENMSGYVCPHCNNESYIMGSGGGEKIAADYNVPVLGRIPLDEVASQDSDRGTPFVTEHPDCGAAQHVHSIVNNIKESIGNV